MHFPVCGSGMRTPNRGLPFVRSANSPSDRHFTHGVLLCLTSVKEVKLQVQYSTTFHSCKQFFAANAHFLIPAPEYVRPHLEIDKKPVNNYN